MTRLENKIKTLVSTVLITATLSGCSTILKPDPVDVRFLNSKLINYVVKIPTHVDKIRINDMRGNTICLRQNVELTPTQTPVGLISCNLKVNQEYEVETITNKRTYKDRIYSSY
jgi:hypothetical protein